MDPIPAPDFAATPLSRVLNRCIRTCIDGERSFASSAADAKDSGVKALFIALAKQRTDFVYALQGVVELLGAVPDDEGTLEGAMDRSYATLVRGAARVTDRSLLLHAERAERLARRTYVSALQDPALERAPPQIVQVLRRQYDAIRRAHEQLRRRLYAF